MLDGPTIRFLPWDGAASSHLGPPIERIGRKIFDVPSQLLVVNLSGRELSREIIESCRSGDREGFRALYDFYKDRVYSIALYFFHGDPAAASDVTQQVFLKLMTSIRQFRGDAEFSTWLYRLVINACMDAARSRKSAGPPVSSGLNRGVTLHHGQGCCFGGSHRRDAVISDRSRMEAFATPASQEEDYARTQMAESVRAAVSALPPKFRIAVLLRYFEDLSYEQMAKVLHCSMGTVASRLSRGHKILVERLKPAIGKKG